MKRVAVRAWLLSWLLPTLLIAQTVAARDAPPLLDLKAQTGKVVVVDFWASWCEPCRRSIPWLNEMQGKYAARGLVVIGVNVDTERSLAERFLAETPARFQVLYDAEGRLPTQYGVQGMPSSFVFDRTGRLVGKHIGFQAGKREEYERLLVNALNGEKE